MYLKNISSVFFILIVGVFIWLLPTPPIDAASNSDADQEIFLDKIESTDDAELSRLLQILEKHTEIATKSKLNADYVPGMVTVLDGKDLMSRGIRDVGEALRLVPGIEVISGNFGSMAVGVRGLAEPLGFPTTKLMLNGIAVNHVFNGSHYSYLGIPSDQVERIEVIRGPGSAVHGGYAYAGVLNIITRTKGDFIYGDTGSYATYGAGGLASWTDVTKDLHVSLNLAGRDTDGADSRSGFDKLHRWGQADISNAPGPANEDRMTHSAIMNLAYKDFSFIAQYLKAGHGDGFGVDNALPPDSDGMAFKNEYRMIELRQGVDIGPALKMNVKLGYLSYESNTDDRVFLYPPGFGPYTYGMYLALHYKEERYSGAINLMYHGWAHHRVFAELSTAQTYQGDDTWRKANFDLYSSEPDPEGNMQRYDDSLIGKDRERRIHSLVLQDEFSASDSFDITGGLRFDSYNDMDDHLSPRLAGVWRLSDTHIFKMQYAQAYMPPSFMQLYHKIEGFGLGNDRLKPQTSDNFELGYIYRGEGNVGRLTLFQSDLADLLVPKDGQWTNSGGARLIGAELELEQSLFDALKLDGNISYAHTQDTETDEPLPETANWWANLGISYKMLRNLVFNAQYRYVGEQNRAPEDTRDALRAFHTVDVTGNLFNLFVRGLTLRAGIKNIFDEDVRYAAPANTYPEDYPQAERRWWCEVSYEF